MRTVSARVALLCSAALLAATVAGVSAGVGALSGTPGHGPTDSHGGLISAHDGAGPSSAPATRAAAEVPPVVASTLLSADGAGPRYTANATQAGPAAQATVQTEPPLPTRTDEYGDPDAVVIRAPQRDFGSGYHGNYGIYQRETSPADQLRAAASASNGCMIIGDSIATFVVKDLVRDLRSTLGETCVYDTWPGRATEGTANALLDIKRRYGLPPRVVVMSGTNDIFNPPLFSDQLDRIVEGIGADHQILWVSTFDSRRPTTAQSVADERNTAWINSVLLQRATRTPNLSIVPWDSLFRGNSRNVDALLADGVHPNPAGIEAMVSLVRRSLS